MQAKQKLKQPKSFFLLCFAEIWERFGYYIIAYLLVLYTEAVFKFTDAQSFALFGIFSGLTVITPAIGGYIGDNYFGVKRSLIFGLLLLGIGYALLAVPGTECFYPGLAFLIVGNGFFKISPSNLLARSYKRDDPRIDSGFTLFYMSINIGSFAATICAGILQVWFGWHAAFLAAAIGIFIGLAGFLKYKHVIKNISSKPGKKSLPWHSYAKVFIGSAVAIYIAAILVMHTGLSDAIFEIAAVCIFIYFFYEGFRSNSEDRQRLAVCITLMVMGMVFFVLYFQAYTSINLFIQRSVNRSILGWTIPTPIFQSLNPFWILALSPILAAIYNRLSAKKKDFAITTKFCSGLVIVTLCFFSLKLSTYFHDAQGKVSFAWIVLAYFLYSLGELLISALGMAMVTKIAPFRMLGVMMGSWFFFVAMGAALAGRFAQLAKVPTNVKNPITMLHIYGHAFVLIGSIGLAAVALAIIVSPFIKKVIDKNNAEKARVKAH